MALTASLWGPGRLGRRLVGAALLGLTFPPWYRLLEGGEGGAAAEQTLRLGHSYTLTLWTWSVLGVAGAVVLGRLLRPGWLERAWRGASDWVLSASVHRFGLGLAVLAAGASLWVSAAVLGQGPILVDGVSQLVQGRYFAAGTLSGPRLEYPEFWQIQSMVLTDAGWASQYPPGFPALLAVGWWLGLTWMVGPVVLGLAVYLTTLCAERLFPDDRIVARIGAALTALSPLLIFHAAAYMNHVLALALLVVSLYASLRAVAGSWTWSFLSGAALGAMFAVRPYTAVVLGFFATVLGWLGAPGQLRRLTGAVAGAAPLVLGTLLYNAYLFGKPTRFGYIAAEGPGHGLGFHVDPWGNPYGPLEAVAYTSADLVGLSADLLQAPIPSLALVALCLLLARRLSRGAALAAAWALLPVAANAFYWHHDLFMGPRLLYEAAPGWCLLLAVSMVWLIRALPDQGGGLVPARMIPKGGVAAVFALSLVVAVLYAGPAKLASYQSTTDRLGMSVRAPEVERASLVFVHGSWEARLGSRLSGLGMRMDSVRSVLEHNSTCRVELFLAGAEDLDFDGANGPFQEVRLPSGSVIRSYPGEDFDPRCERQAASDFGGVVDLAPLVWQGDLPGLKSRGAMFVRDFGPEVNARLLERFPEREPRVLIRRGAEMRLLSYAQGMARLWSGE